MISVADAQALVRAQAAPLPSERVPLALALGRVNAHAVVSAVDLPPFDNSAMDGFALCGAGQTLHSQCEFDVAGELAAGDSTRHVEGDHAWEIMTGAALPAGLDTVVPVEQVEVLARDEQARPLRIRLLAEVPPMQHVRRAGEDIARGQTALPAAQWLGASHLLLLAGLGIGEIDVARRPRVALLCTGRELVDDPAQALQPGQIRNSNASFLRARIIAAGAELAHYETVPDDADAFRAALNRALLADRDVVLSTGAVSMGRYDFVPQVLEGIGARTLFHKVAMRPGKPMLFARLAEGPLYFGLPGNPVSSVVGLRFFVEAALRVMLGLPPERAWSLPLLHHARKKPGFRLHQKARVVLGSDARLGVELLPGQESFKTRPLLAANAWAALPAESCELPAGSLIEVLPLGHEGGIHLGEQRVGEPVA